MSNEDFNKVVAANIRKYLALSGITQSELAGKLGISKSAVSAWCNGQKSPRMDLDANGLISLLTRIRREHHSLLRRVRSSAFSVSSMTPTEPL